MKLLVLLLLVALCATNPNLLPTTISILGALLMGLARMDGAALLLAVATGAALTYAHHRTHTHA